MFGPLDGSRGPQPGARRYGAPVGAALDRRCNATLLPLVSQPSLVADIQDTVDLPAGFADTFKDRDGYFAALELPADHPHVRTAEVKAAFRRKIWPAYQGLCLPAWPWHPCTCSQQGIALQEDPASPTYAELMRAYRVLRNRKAHTPLGDCVRV